MFPKLSRYQVLGRLAVGGMAEVWLGRSIGFAGFEKLVVLKTILPNLLTNPQFVQMFVNEARVAAMLNHPNCVTVFDLGKEDETVYIAMEYIEGFALSRVLKKAKDKGIEMPVDVLARIACDALSGLEYAHKLTDREGRALDLIHRDVSPDNLLIGFTGQTKLVDFGIAKAAMSTMAQTRAGTVKGKFGYIAPEYLRGERIDGRADLFALGVVLYRALTGTRPFVGDNEAAVTMAVMQKSPPTPASVAPRVSPEVSGVVMLALEKKPDARFDSARAMRMALEAAVKPAETDGVVAFLNHLWPVGDPERVKLTSLASGNSEESSDPALESIVSQGFSLPQGALSTPPPARFDAHMAEQATRAGVMPETVKPWAPPVVVAVEDDTPPKSRLPAVAVLLVAALAGGAGVWNVMHRSRPVNAAPVDDTQATVTPNAAVAEPQVQVDVGEAVTVLEADRELGKAPLTFSLAAGPHTLRLVSKTLGVDQTFDVVARPGETARIDALRKGSLSVKVEPWAYVKLDGKTLGQTPVAKRDLYEGVHMLELANSELNANRRVEVKVKAGETKVVSVKLEE